MYPRILVNCLAMTSLFFAASGQAEEAVNFIRDIRPILADNCFTCHGPDEAHREASLRLDLASGAFAEADSGARAIVPGEPDESELLARVASEDEFERMPPPDAGDALTKEEIDLLRRWIEQGAEWEAHWSLSPPKDPEIPQVQDEAWPRNEIDRFILARLEKEELSPNRAVDRETLIRRVTLDLTGLPPSLEEVDAFLRDTAPNAYERVVNRLLESNRYGEHMARYWLDAARYGDTHGLHLDNYREMWPYRDWAITAFNENMHYDQFITEQLAGDLLPDPTLDQLIATGFNRCHVTTSEGGSIEDEVYVRNVVDRVVTVGTVFMGMTFECTRCHDHKYDPLTMNDFYSMFAYFNSIDGKPLDGNRKDHAPVIQVPTTEQQHELTAYESRIGEIEARLKADWPEVDQQQQAWEAEMLARDENSDTTANIGLEDWHFVGPFGDTRRYLFNRKHGPEGKPIDLKQEFTLATEEIVTWQQRPEWVDGQVHRDLPGDMAANFLYRKITSPDEQKVTASLGSDDAVKVYLNGEKVFEKDVSRGVAPDQDILDLPLKQGDNELLMKVMNYGGNTGFYFKVMSATPLIPDEIVSILETAPEDRTAEDKAELQKHYRFKVAAHDELQQAKSRLAKLREQRAELERQIPTTLIWKERKEPRPAFVLRRGEYDQPLEERQRLTPVVLPPMREDWPNDRLGLAMWLVDPAHPLTARVAVNRFWQQLFGTGIVKTAEDFGTRGETPVHPELLDWLSIRFLEEGWDVKALMKRMVMSATYQQSSQMTQEAHVRDPDNRLLARGPRFRLEAEMLRDQALSVSGLLVEQFGGPSVKPPQPDGLWFAVGYSGSNTVRFVPDTDLEKIHRRSVYTFIKRTAPPPQMSTFDSPSREACAMRRERTNTPLQALLLFNDPQYVEAAIGLAQRALREGGETDNSRAEYMFRLCASRYPTAGELQDLINAVQVERESFARREGAAENLLQVASFLEDTVDNANELAAWTMTANLLLNLDEVLTKN